MLRIILQSDLKEGRWRNGQGVSWEIASHKQAGAADFSWRFAKARIEHNVPFSIYPGMDRIFMMIEGDGMDLEFAGGQILLVHEKFVPHTFSCDVPLNCKLVGGPSLDLNLFTSREEYNAYCEVIKVHESDVTVFYVLEGSATFKNAKIEAGDSVVIDGEESIVCSGQNALIYVGKILRK
jgi:uncharacterized protein